MKTKTIKVTQLGRTYWDGTGLLGVEAEDRMSYCHRELFLEVPAEWDAQRIQQEVEARTFDVLWAVRDDNDFDEPVGLGDDEVCIDALDCRVEDDESQGVTRYSLTEGGEDWPNMPMLQMSSEMVTKALAEGGEVTP
jgi:hypothetical protein